jgi:hypothetical protein
LEIASQIDMLSLRTEPWSSPPQRNPRRPYHPFVVPDEGSQKVFVPDRGASDERRKGLQHIFCGMKKHLMNPNHTGPVFPSHCDHGSRVVREGERHRGVEKFPEP